jgi:hypothetical protein
MCFHEAQAALPRLTSSTDQTVPSALAGVIAEPYTCLTDLTADDAWLIVTSDGLLANEERGGGGGLTCVQLIKTPLSLVFEVVGYAAAMRHVY